MKKMIMILLGLMVATPLGGCVISGPLGPDDDDSAAGDDDDAGDDDSAIADDDDIADDDASDDDEVCPGSFVQYWTNWFRDTDGDGCLDESEWDTHDDMYVSVATCGDGTFATVWAEGDVAPGLPGAPFFDPTSSSSLCEEEDDDDVADDDDATPPADDDDVSDDDDDDASADDDDATPADDDDVADLALVEVTRTGFSGAWDLRIFNWDLLVGSWWGTSPEYCAYGLGNDLGCNVAIMPGDRFSINGVISSGGWLVTAAPADFVGGVEVNGVEYPITTTRSVSPAVGPWTDVPMGTCRYGATGHNDLWCRGASSL